MTELVMLIIVGCICGAFLVKFLESCWDKEIMMQIYTELDMTSGRSECYGCNTLTSNVSGMCSACGGSDKDTESTPMRRTVHTLSEATLMIEGQR